MPSFYKLTLFLFAISASRETEDFTLLLACTDQKLLTDMFLLYTFMNIFTLVDHIFHYPSP